MSDSPVETTPRIAERLARLAHQDQVDRGSGRPYIEHVERVVANLLRRWPDATENEIAGAWLHDVPEDTKWTFAMLLEAGVPPGAAGIVRELTRPDGVTYRNWMRDLAEHGSLSAVKIKLSDNADNSSPERIASIPEGQSMLDRRYLPAKAILEARIARDQP